MASKNKLRLNLNLIVRSSFIVFLGIFLSKALSYIYRIVIARYYGPEAYGLFSLALVVSGWFITLSALGFYEGLTRFIPLYRGKNQEKKIRHLINFSLLVLAVTSIVSAVPLYLFSDFISLYFFHNPSLTIFLKISAILVPISVLAYPFVALLRGYEMINLYSFTLNILPNVIKLVSLVLLIMLGLSSSSTILSYLIGVTGMLIVSYLLCRYKMPDLFIKNVLSKKDKDKISNELINYSIPLLFYGILYLVLYWIDTFSIGYYKGAYEVGIYNAAVPIATLLAVTPELFMQLFFPLITKEYARKNISLIKQLSKQVGKWIFLINLPAFILLVLFPGAAINLLFGPQYLVAENALRILALGSLISSVFVVSNNLISITGRSKTILLDISLAAALNFILNSFLVPLPIILGLDNSLGIIGAATATLISIIVLNFLFLLQSYFYVKIVPVRRKFINCLIAVLVSSSILFYLKSVFAPTLVNILILCIVFLVSYVLLLFLFKALDKNDIDMLKTITLKLKDKVFKLPL